jgi:hypothetical protein
MIIEYASEQDTTALLTRRAVLFKTSEGARDRTGWQRCGAILKKAHNIFPANGVILMNQDLLLPLEGFDDLP